jgi:hypothetical protein
VARGWGVWVYAKPAEFRTGRERAQTVFLGDGGGFAARSNLSGMLRTMAGYRLVRLERGERGGLRPGFGCALQGAVDGGGVAGDGAEVGAGGVVLRTGGGAGGFGIVIPDVARGLMCLPPDWRWLRSSFFAG